MLFKSKLKGVALVLILLISLYIPFFILDRFLGYPMEKVNVNLGLSIVLLIVIGWAGVLRSIGKKRGGDPTFPKSSRD